MIAEANFRHNDINSFLDELGEAQDKEKFFKEYVKSVRLNDQKVNSVISLYSNQEILKEYFAGVENIREVIAFPMNQQAQDLMMNAPSEISSDQLKEIGIKIIEKKE